MEFTLMNCVSHMFYMCFTWCVLYIIFFSVLTESYKLQTCLQNGKRLLIVLLSILADSNNFWKCQNKIASSHIYIRKTINKHEMIFVELRGDKNVTSIQPWDHHKMKQQWVFVPWYLHSLCITPQTPRGLRILSSGKQKLACTQTIWTWSLSRDQQRNCFVSKSLLRNIRHFFLLLISNSETPPLLL